MPLLILCAPACNSLIELWTSQNEYHITSYFQGIYISRILQIWKTTMKIKFLNQILAQGGVVSRLGIHEIVIREIDLEVLFLWNMQPSNYTVPIKKLRL